MKEKCKEYKKTYEKIDIYDEKRIKTGRIIERKDGEIINDNEFILAVQCWIINAQNKILLTQRKKSKKDGEMWEPTSGLVQSGENSIQGIKRELKEEIRVEIDSANIILFKTAKEKHTYRDIYIIKKDIPIETLKFNDDEVVDAKYVTIEELNQMINNGEAFEWLRWFLEDYAKIIKIKL